MRPQVPLENLEKLVAGNNQFAFDLFQAVHADRKNLFYSPFSLSTALAMTYGGARGETEQQMAETLHFTLTQPQLHRAFNALDLSLNPPAQSQIENQEGFQLTVANSVWGQLDFEYQPAYLDLLAEHYGAGLRFVDFVDPIHREQARLAINAWVSERTQAKVQNIIPENVLTKFTRLVLANAIYFKADWEEPFSNGTSDADFQLLDGRQVAVPMMSRRTSTEFIESQLFQAVKIPYQGGRTEMIVILPREGELEAVEDLFDGDLIRRVNDAFKPTDLYLYMPRFEYETSFSLAKVLAEMGMPDAFDPVRADFTGMAVQLRPRLHIGHVLHKAFVAVNEIGTEAAASTAVIIQQDSAPLVIRIERPFLFMIRESVSGTILFLGRVVDPR